MANTTKATARNAGQAEDTGSQELVEAQPKTNPDLTPYAAAKVVTAAVRKRTGNVDFTMQPQTMYGLAKRDVIDTIEVPGSKPGGKSKIYFKGTSFELAEELPGQRQRRPGQPQHRLRGAGRAVHRRHPGRGGRPRRAGRAARGHRAQVVRRDRLGERQDHG